MIKRHICLSRISDFVIYMYFHLAIAGEQLAKLNKKKMDCRDTAPLKKPNVLSWAGLYPAFEQLRPAYNPGGGGGLPYETDGDARRQFWI